MKKFLIAVGTTLIAAAVIFSVYSTSDQENLNLDMNRQHGAVNTAMASPILGAPSAPITIISDIFLLQFIFII